MPANGPQRSQERFLRPFFISPLPAPAGISLSNGRLLSPNAPFLDFQPLTKNIDWAGGRFDPGHVGFRILKYKDGSGVVDVCRGSEKEKALPPPPPNGKPTGILSGRSSQRIKKAGAILEATIGRDRLRFCTLTISRFQEPEEITNAFTRLQKSLTAYWLRYGKRIAGKDYSPPVFLWVKEWQEKRSRNEGVLYLHYHFVTNVIIPGGKEVSKIWAGFDKYDKLPTRQQKRDWVKNRKWGFLLTPSRLENLNLLKMWERSLKNSAIYCKVEFPGDEKGRVEIRKIKKSVAGYLAKYLSKGSKERSDYKTNGEGSLPGIPGKIWGLNVEASQQCKPEISTVYFMAGKKAQDVLNQITTLIDKNCKKARRKKEFARYFGGGKRIRMAGIKIEDRTKEIFEAIELLHKPQWKFTATIEAPISPPGKQEALFVPDTIYFNSKTLARKREPYIQTDIPLNWPDLCKTESLFNQNTFQNERFKKPESKTNCPNERGYSDPGRGIANIDLHHIEVWER